MLLAMLLLIMMQLHFEARSNDRAATAAAADALTVAHFQGCKFRDDELDADDEECDDDDDGYGTHGLGSYTSNIPQSSH